MAMHQRILDGLSSSEAAKRLAQYGPNVLASKRTTPWWLIFARQFSSVLILILIAAAVLAAAMGETIDAAAIGAIVILNGILGFVQEWRAERTLDALKALLTSQAMVRRDGIEQLIDVCDLVPGDLVILEAGNRVPADITLNEIMELRVDESILTGESESITKQLTHSDDHEASLSKVFMGTNVVNGRASGVVTKTGMHTEFGRIASLTSAVGAKPTHLQRKLGLLGQQLGLVAIGLGLLVIAVGWLSGKAFEEMVLTGLSLAVAIVPEGLPAVVTVTLALGANAMVKRNALSRRLQASETLGAASVICTDKTGTLTENQMTIAKVWLPDGVIDVTGTGYDPAGHFEKEGERFDYHSSLALTNLLQTGLICNHARIEKLGAEWVKIGEPTEAAFVVAAYKAWLPEPDRNLILREIPFSSERKRMSVLTEEGGNFVVHAKGAPEAIFSACETIAVDGNISPFDPDNLAKAKATYDDMASNGMRVLALARKEVPSASIEDMDMECGLTLMGLVGIIDPPRPEVKAAVQEAHDAGIEVVMITGDAPGTALAIAKMLDLRSQRAVTGDMLDTMDDDVLAECLAEEVVFARTTPEHKMRIVECLQAHSKIVAMTGDGVNDAPALKRSDIGIAMGIRGTDVAKDASDLVLLDDNFASIVHAIEEGRRQYANIKKFVRYLLTSNAGEVVAIIANLIIGGPLIFLPIQILWMNLVTDGLTALTLGLERSEPNAMKLPPRPAREGIIEGRGLIVIVLFALYTGSASLFAFYSVLDQGVLLAQTVAFTTMILLEKFSVFAFRSLTLPLAKTGFFTNPWLLAAVAVTVGVQVAAVYWPPLQALLHTTAIDTQTWGMIAILLLPVIIVPDLVKRFL